MTWLTLCRRFNYLLRTLPFRRAISESWPLIAIHWAMKERTPVFALHYRYQYRCISIRQAGFWLARALRPGALLAIGPSPCLAAYAKRGSAMTAFSAPIRGMRGASSVEHLHGSMVAVSAHASYGPPHAMSTCMARAERSPHGQSVDTPSPLLLQRCLIDLSFSTPAARESRAQRGSAHVFGRKPPAA